MQKYFLTLIIVLLTFSFFSVHAQTYVNREWVKVQGTPDSIDWSASTYLWGQVITTANTVTAGQQANSYREGILHSGASGSTAVGLRTGTSFSKTLLKDYDVKEKLFPTFEMSAQHYLWDFTLGVSFRHQLSANWFLSSDFLYETKGHQFEFIFNDDIVSDEYVAFYFKYLSLPVYISAQKHWNRFSAYAGTGVYVSYLADMKQLHSGHRYTLSPRLQDGDGLEMDERAAYESVDFGVGAQAGIIVPIEEGFEIDFQIAFSHGLLSAGGKENNDCQARYFHRSLMISFGFRSLL